MNELLSLNPQLFIREGWHFYLMHLTLEIKEKESPICTTNYPLIVAVNLVRGIKIAREAI